MSALTLNVLGDLEVIRDGQALMLPPSKKTRALLAYLAVNARPFSREHLCDLLWELPDDPRGSLRWSLSKLRRLVDDPDHPRIIADRLAAALDTRDIGIDVAALHRLARQDLQAATIEELEATAARYRGPFLEGLDLPNFHDFHSWCLAEREGALRAQTFLLQALVDCLADDPERALPHAHSLVRLSPFDEDARARLIRLLLALNRPRDAEQHFQLGMRLLKQAGITPQGALLRARRTVPGHTLASEPAGSAPPLDDDVGHDEPWDALLARLDTPTRDVLRWAAILTPCLDTPWLARVSGMPAHQIGEAMEAAERLNLLEATDRGLCFSDERVAHCLYEGISPARRQFMHHHVAELLARDNVLDLEHAADLAHHAQLSGDPGLAADALVTAGRLCLRFFANEEAQRMARKGLAMAERLSGGQRICLFLELREIMLSAAPLADWEATANELVMLAEQALEHGALAHARLGYQLASQVLWAHGQWSGAHEEALQAERMTRSAGDHEQIIAMAETAKCLAMLERDLDQAAAMLTEARELARQQRVSHPAIPMALGLLSYHDNRMEDAERHFKEARTLCKASGDRLCEFQANEYLMMLDIEQAHYASAQRRCDGLVEIGEKLRDGSEAPFAHAAQALCRYALDDDTTPLDRALPALRDADAKHRLSYLLTHAALLDVERDRPSEAVAHAAEALDNARVLERATEQMLAHCVLAEAHRTRGETAAHRQHAKAVATLEQAPVARWAWCRVAGLRTDRPVEGRT